MTTPRERQRLYWQGQVYTMTWMNAANLQGNRILDHIRRPGTADLVEHVATQVVIASDTLTYPISLSLVRRAATLAMRYAVPTRSAEIRDAVQCFDLAVPATADVRNILSHFDAYADGGGHLQAAGAVDPGSGLWHTIRYVTHVGTDGDVIVDAHYISVSIDMTQPPIELDIVSSLQAGHDLTEVVLSDIPSA
ncbi:hypothetical protein Daura_23070 [Dactylosporangium aurantiacum]|uniref:Uncharacterized protein n=1 Tax=Dactylosporangium aurantiacum TaxID=35754 RepID=A0A9Q9MGX7_9ACTN|nr:hypothetical protein [Dactylosporangium aurantiacum]MDG6104032.1 hypothetical protein [Dactylosporangium aurantiacum]UWZ58793.1 hypothetical protein Daura_23070 [Dactylosporangium aurantiacum]